MINQFETGRIPGWAFVLGAGVLVAVYIIHEERKEKRKPGALSGKGCRDKEGVFVPVPQCRRRRARK